jgi:hypothetical protein
MIYCGRLFSEEVGQVYDIRNGAQHARATAQELWEMLGFPIQPRTTLLLMIASRSIWKTAMFHDFDPHLLRSHDE